MSVKRRVNWISQQRVDVPDMRALESAASNDFDELIKSFVTGTTQGYILRGFEISMAGAIGGAASGLQMIVDPGAIFHVASSQSGTFLLVPSGTPAQQLNSATNTIVDGAFAPSSINYVGVEYERFIDDTTSSQVYLWNPTTNNETTKNAPRAQILRYRFKITTSTFASNVLPVCTVITDSGNNVVSITDARWMLFRLGQGGASPNPFYQYPWTAQPEGRLENPSTSSSNGINPFHGGDKMLMTLKDWMNAIMSALQEIKGTTYWYQAGSAGSIDSLRTDLGNTLTTGAGTITHSADTAGLVTWDEDIFLTVIGSRLQYKLSANDVPSTDITLADNEVAYINLVRGVAITPNLVFTNSSAIVQSVGSISWTGPLQAGDWVKLASDTDQQLYQIQSIDSLSQVTLTIPYNGASTGAPGAKAKYSFGTYNASASPSTSRDIFIADRADVPQGQDVWWFLLRADNGGAIPRVYVRFIGQELEQGETEEIDDGVSRQLLQYIGSPSESASKPNYSSALNPGSLPEITDILCGTAASMSSNQYFFIQSSADARKYYVWVNKDGTGVDPAPAADRLPIEWPVTTGQTDAQVATALASALSTTVIPDFTAVTRANPNQMVVRVTNNSAGTCSDATNFNVSAPFAVTIIQQGTGVGNYIVNDGDNLTLAIKKLDNAIANMVAGANNPNYDEAMAITASVMSGTNLTLPLNTRLGNIPQLYTVGKGALQVFLNGQYLNLTTGNINSETAMLRYHMDDGTYPTNTILTGALDGGLAVQYTPGSNVSLSDIRFILSRSVSGTGTGLLTARVRANNAGVPGSVLGSSTSFPVSSLINGFSTQVDFGFTSSVALTSGTIYWFTLETDAAYQAVNGTTGCDVQVRNPNITTSSTIAVDFINHTTTVNDNDHDLGDAGPTGIIEGPWFESQFTGEIQTAQVSVTYVSGTGMLWADLYHVIPDNTGAPNQPTMTLLETTAVGIDITTLPTGSNNPALTTVTFDGTTTLTAGQQYAVVLRVDNFGGNVTQHNSRLSGPPLSPTGLIARNFSFPFSFFQSTATDNPLVYAGDVDVIASGQSTSLAGEYPVATYDGSTWTAQTSSTPAIELDISGASVPNYDWSEVGASNTLSNTIQINRNLVPGDVLTFRIGAGGGGGGGGGGGVGPQGPPGPTGPAGADALGGPVAISTKIADYTVLNSDNVLLGNNTPNSSNIIFTLPTAASAAGQVFFFKKIDAAAFNVTVQGNGAELIDGSNTFVINTQFAAITVVSDGAQWWII